MSRDREVVEKVITSLKSIGQFELSPLRETGPGASFKAVDPNRRIAVSIRTIWPAEAADPADCKLQLLTHARGAQTLEHSNIAKVIGSGELDGAFFLVSSFIEGRSLRQNLSSGDNLNIWELIDFARQCCTGLEFAHSRGIIHHALHPGNIVLEMDGSTKILDVGYYRSNVPHVERFTGTACYLAPEQLAGHAADRIANFYSVAVMLYEIATGSLPYAGENWDALAFASQSEIIEPIKINRQLPEGINAAIMKALARDRSARYQSGPELVRALEDYKNFGKPKNVAPAPKPKVVSIDGAAAQPTPIRNPYATAPDLAPATDPRLYSESENRSSVVGADKPALVGANEPALWKRPVEAPPVPVVEPGLELPIEVPSPHPDWKAEAKVLARRAAEAAWVYTRREVKRVDPWVYALAVFIIILGSFVSRTIILSFYPPQPEHYESFQPIQAPPQNPAPAPAVQESAPQAPPSPAPTPQNAVASPEHTPRRKSSAKPVPPGPALYSASRPLPPSGTPLGTTGTVAITSVPAGARVIVDGKANQSFTTPNVIEALAPGVHTFTVSKDGYSPATRPVQVTAGTIAHLTVQLDLPSGFITVLSNPSGAYILVDNVSTGHVTPSQVPVPPGTHTLTLRKFGYLETTDTFTVKSAEQQSRNVTLLEAGSTPEIKVVQNTGVHKMFGGNKVQGVKITVRTTPPGATVYISGQQIQKPTPVEFGLNPGSYSLQIELPGRQRVQKSITVENGKPQVIEETLQP